MFGSQILMKYVKDGVKKKPCSTFGESLPKNISWSLSQTVSMDVIIKIVFDSNLALQPLF